MNMPKKKETIKKEVKKEEVKYEKREFVGTGITRADDLIENVLLAALKNFPKYQWPDKSVCEFLDDKKEVIGKIIIKDMNFNYEGCVVKLIDDLVEKFKKVEKEKLTKEKVRETIFSETCFDRKDSFNGLFNNPILFYKIEKELKEAGIGKIEISPSVRSNNTISKTISVNITPIIDGGVAFENGFLKRINGILFEKYKDLSDIQDPNMFKVYNDGFKLTMFEGEKAIPINIGNANVGNYYPERNYIHLFYNPFLIRRVLPLQENIPITIKDLIEAIKEVKVAITNVTDVEEKLFATAFLNKANEKLESIRRDLRDNLQRVKDNETNIRNAFQRRNELEMEKLFIEKNISSGGKQIFSELEEVKKLSFIDKVGVSTDRIIMRFKPTTITMPNFKRGDCDKARGKRIGWLGWIEVEISPSEFDVRGETDIEGHAHPHAAGNPGGPCFGDGEGRAKIYEMLAANKFSELATLLWFWVKIYKNDGAYVKMWDFYDDRLKQGYPVWDEKGKRIEINDPKLIEAGEQRKLEKAPNYQENWEKYKDFKLTIN
jgi:hypothetical protein